MMIKLWIWKRRKRKIKWAQGKGIIDKAILVLALSTEYRRQSTKGYPAMVDLSVGVRMIRNRMVTQGAETAI